MASGNRQDPYEQFRDEILDEAVAICRGKPAGDLTKPRIAHLRGVMALQRADTDLAIAYFTHSVRLDPSAAAVYCDLGEAFMRQRRYDEGVAAHLCAVVLSRAVPAALGRLGLALHHAKRPTEALALLTMAEDAFPSKSDVHGHLGEVLAAHSRFAQALAQYEEATRLSPDDADWLMGLGRIRLRLRNPTEALEAFKAALRVAPARAHVHVGIAEASIHLGRLDEALAALRTALNISPSDVSAIHKLVFVLELLGRRDDAVGAWAALGSVLEGQGSFKEAQAAYEKAVAGKADCLRAIIGLGRVYSTLNYPELAIERFKSAIAIAPALITGHVRLGGVLHAVGDERAWDELACYHDRTNPDWRHVEQPLWTGFELDGRRVLLWSDEHRSDALLFIRYAQAAKSLGGHVIVECDRELMPLMQRAEGVDCVVPKTGPCVPYDVHAPLRYFPALTRLHPASRPKVPYLSVPGNVKRTWRARLGKRTEKFVGLSWAGGPYDTATSARYIPLSNFQPLADLTGHRLVSLQLGDACHALLAPPSGLVVKKLLGDDASIIDLAALISNLDLVITTDGVVAHLAGALGKPTWVLLPLSLVWPWPHECVTSHYYPSVRLFRQSRHGDWSDVAHEILHELQKSGVPLRAAESTDAETSS